MDIILIDEKIRNNLIFTDYLKIEIIELEKVLESLTKKQNILKCKKKREFLKSIEEKVELNFYFLETSHIIEKYKKILSKPIFRSNENDEKSDIVKEYIKIVNDKYLSTFYQSEPKKIDILEIVKLEEPSHKKKL